MLLRRLFQITCAVFWALTCCLSFTHAQPAQTPDADAESRFLSNTRQITFEGLRAGEGYFGSGAQGSTKMVFQSERRADNPFFQIYTLDFETGDTSRISPGHGKTTCAWLHPDGNRVLYASTQFDPEARQKQIDELAFRESGQTRRYAWDYDPAYELVAYDQTSKTYQRLTEAKGYDAEASYSPNGKLIAFASNRAAYTTTLSEADQKLFETDPSSMMDLYVMNADGSDIRQLTDEPGYDGGPFFSPDGQRICWRRFSKDGLLAEIYTMNIDGTDPQQLTKMNVMSWAPFYHPSGDYLVFTTNKHGFSNFELYIVAANPNAVSAPVRITTTEGFDGLASFTPDGKKLTWTSNRNAQKQSQIFLADWNHELAKQALRIQTAAAGQTEASDQATTQGVAAAQMGSSDFEAADIARHVDYLCRQELGGRMTGSPGERQATAYVAAYLSHLGCQPLAGENYFQPFDFPQGAKLLPGNALAWEIGSATPQTVAAEDFRPLTFSANTTVDNAQVVFAGYGIVAPKTDKFDEYDSYVHLDVKDKWALVFRFVPEDVAPQLRQHLKFYSGLRKKLFHARQNGAIGLIVVSGPTSQVRNQLVPLRNDFAPSGASIAAISVKDNVVQQWLAANGKQLEDLQKRFDNGEPAMGFDLKGVKVSANVAVKQTTGRGRNVVARLQLGNTPSAEVIVVGAHIDHLGKGSASSLATENQQGKIHVGADDNASGVAAMLEIAEYLSHLKSIGKTDTFKRDIVFAAWSGEELGLHGSKHFTDTLLKANETSKPQPSLNVAAALNMDMVGRLEDKLILQGIGSSPTWAPIIERKNIVVGLPLTLSDDTDLPTDATSFYQSGVPILSAFTGSHTDYHTPQDTPEKLNYPDAARIAKLMGLVTAEISKADTKPEYLRQASKPKKSVRGGVRAYLGTIPSYGDDVVGVKLSGTTAGAPADVAGVKGGDIIVELAGQNIENIYDYTTAIDGLKIGQETTITVTRGQQRLEMKITPKSRQ